MRLTQITPSNNDPIFTIEKIFKLLIVDDYNGRPGDINNVEALLRETLDCQSHSLIDPRLVDIVLVHGWNGKLYELIYINLKFNRALL